MYTLTFSEKRTPMIMTLKNFLPIAACITFITGTCSAEILLYSPFNGSIQDGTSKLGVTWSGTEAAGGTFLTAVDPLTNGFAHHLGTPLGAPGTAFLNTNLNVSPTDLHGFSFTFTPSQNYDLDYLTVRVAHAQSSGAPQTFTSDLNLTILGLGGSGSLVNTEKAGLTYTGDWRDETFDLSGTSLTASESYIISVGMDNLTGAGAGAYFTADSLELVAIPDPSTLGLLGLSLLVLLAVHRRRA
jgi:MYXO-CTERM domain-containing protein